MTPEEFHVTKTLRSEKSRSIAALLNTFATFTSFVLNVKVFNWCQIVYMKPLNELSIVKAT